MQWHSPSSGESTRAATRFAASGLIANHASYWAARAELEMRRSNTAGARELYAHARSLEAERKAYERQLNEA
jgi:hypothetical protein